MANFEKYFTVDEANALLPELRKRLQSIQTLRESIPASYRKAAPVLRLVRWDSGGREAADYTAQVWHLTRHLRRLQEMGIQLKDLDRGLVDFPAWRADQEVLLCWHLGEDEVGHWHDLESGYAGRQPL